MSCKPVPVTHGRKEEVMTIGLVIFIACMLFLFYSLFGIPLIQSIKPRLFWGLFRMMARKVMAGGVGCK
jgi:hypothetical protein